MVVIDLVTPEADKKPRARRHALSPPTAVAESSIIDLSVNSPSLVSFRGSTVDDVNDRRHFDCRPVDLRLPGLPHLPLTNHASSATHGAYSHAPVTHSLPRRKVSWPFLDPRSSGKENSDPSQGGGSHARAFFGRKIVIVTKQQRLVVASTSDIDDRKIAAPVTHSTPRTKVSRPFLDPRSSRKENSDPSPGGSDVPRGVKLSKLTFFSTKHSPMGNYPLWVENFQQLHYQYLV